MQNDNAWDRLSSAAVIVELPEVFAYSDTEELLAVARYTAKRQRKVLQ